MKIDLHKKGHYAFKGLYLIGYHCGLNNLNGLNQQWFSALASNIVITTHEKGPLFGFKVPNIYIVYDL